MSGSPNITAAAAAVESAGFLAVVIGAAEAVAAGAGAEAALPVSTLAGTVWPGAVAQPAKKASAARADADTRCLKVDAWKTDRAGGDKVRGEKFEEDEDGGNEIDGAELNVI